MANGRIEIYDQNDVKLGELDAAVLVDLGQGTITKKAPDDSELLIRLKEILEMPELSVGETMRKLRTLQEAIESAEPETQTVTDDLCYTSSVFKKSGDEIKLGLFETQGEAMDAAVALMASSEEINRWKWAYVGY